MEQYGSTGGGSAHRSTKCMFTVAYLDGKKPSIVIGRGIYERIKMEAWDFDGTTLTKRWHFDTEYAPEGYHGSGNHNLSQADVDYDGKDEIVYGAMVIDDDGTGLNTTGLGHGDAIHVSDFNPDRFGLEVWRCLENNPYGATLSAAEDAEILIRYFGNRDCGRCCAGDINPDYPGAELWAATECPSYTANGDIWLDSSPWPMNSMIWWDGDLLREFLDHSGFTIENGVGTGCISKRTSNNGRETLLLASGTYSNNWSKGNTCISADIFGDWREEVIWRREDNQAMRIYYTTDPTEHRLYTLMHDAQYRAAIGWQMNSYNQPPHPSFFIGHDMDSVPPPCIVTNELVWKAGSAWDNSSQNWAAKDVTTAFTDGDDVLFDLSGDNSGNISITGSLSPRSVRIQTATDYTFEGSGSLNGDMDLIKAGTGKLVFNNENNYTGLTRLFLGKLEINGNLPSSTVIIKRFAEFYGGASVGKDVVLQKGSHLYCGSENGAATDFNIGGSLKMLGKANIHLDLSDNADGSAKTNDKIVIAGDLIMDETNTITITMLDGDLEAGTYDLIQYSGAFTGDIAKIKIGGIPTKSVEVVHKSGVIAMEVKAIRTAGDVEWSGTVDNVWDLAETTNWLNSGVADYFVGGDNVEFNDNGSANTSIELVGELPVAAVNVNSSIDYTFKGGGYISGEGGLTKSGSGTLTVKRNNTYTGATIINEGTLSVPELASGGNASPIGASTSDAGNLVINGGTLEVTYSGTNLSDRNITIGEQNGTIQVGSSTTLVLDGVLEGTGKLIKTGDGSLNLGNSNNHAATVIKGGTINLATDNANVGGLGESVTFEGGTVSMTNSITSYTNDCNWDIIVPEGKVGTLVADGRCQLKGKLTGDGRLNFYTPFVRTDLMGNWSEFTGTINVSADGDGGDFRHYNRYGYPNATLIIGNNVNFYVESNGGSSTQSIGTLMLFSSASMNGSGSYFTWKIGTNNGNSLVYGTISGNYLSIEKVGTGTMTLKGANTYGRNTLINGGALICTNTTGSATGTSSVAVNASGELKGTGTVSGPVTVNNEGTLSGTLTLNGAVNVNDGGTMAPAGSSIGALQFNHTLKFNSAGIYNVNVIADTEAADVVNVAGTVTLNGVLAVSKLGSAPFKNGNKFHIINAAAINGTFSSVEPAQPGEGLQWDLSDIQNGNLGVTIATGMNLLDDAAIRVAPNPTFGQFLLSLGEPVAEGKYEILNMTGSIVQSGKITEESEVEININQHPKGVYLLQVMYNDKYVVKRIILK